MSSEEPLKALEERYTHLQRHIAEQDKEIHNLRMELDRLRKDFVALRRRIESEPPRDGPGDAGDERPPHY